MINILKNKRIKQWFYVADGSSHGLFLLLFYDVDHEKNAAPPYLFYFP